MKGAKEHIMEKFAIKEHHMPYDDLRFSGDELVDLISEYALQESKQAREKSIQECIDKAKSAGSKGSTIWILIWELEKLKHQ